MVMNAWNMLPQGITLDEWRREEWAKRQEDEPYPDRPPLALLGHILARVNHGRWIADCQTCKAAQLADAVDSYMLCVECGSGEWWVVDFPDDKALIEECLEHRMSILSWEPGETVADLIEENRKHGLGEPSDLDRRTDSQRG